MKLPKDVNKWPEEQRYQFYERWNIRQFDGHLGEEQARMLAEQDVRREVGRDQGRR